MAPKIGNKMQKKVLKIKRKSKEDRMKEMVRNKKNAEKMKQSKEVPLLLIKLNNVYLENLRKWLSNFSEAALTEMQRKEVDFGLLLAKIGLLPETFIKVTENPLGELAQKCDAGTEPTKTPDKRPELILDNKLLHQTPWLDLLKFLLQEGEKYEKMCVSHVERAMELLNLGFAKSVHRTIKEKLKIPDGDLHEGIRHKLLLQKQVAEAKKAEKAKKEKEAQTALSQYTNLGGPLTWEKGYRPVGFVGLLPENDPRIIFAPFGFSACELQSLLDEARKLAEGTSVTMIHAAALLVYSGEHYAKLNMLLRTRGNEDKLKDYAHYLIHLRNALGNLKALQGEERIVHRGTKFFELYLEVGQKLMFQAPTSASKSIDVANRFMESEGLHFVIETLTGKSIESFSYFPKEVEVLLPPNSCFEVKQITSDQEEIEKVLRGLAEHKRQRIRTMVVLEQYA